MFKLFLAAVLVFQACSAFPKTPSYITDGQDALPGEFPYQVSILWGIPPFVKDRHICGGSIINEHYILTAGHCVLDMGKYKVAAGKHRLNKQDPTEQVVRVEETIVHESYPGGVAQHDIALLKLATPLVFNDRVAPIKLPALGEKQVGRAILSGWGSISKTILPALPQVLQKAVMPILENDDCLKQLTTNRPVVGDEPVIFDTQVCTGAEGTEVSACSGDSGGPLAQVIDGEFVQVGVVSWGMMPCGVGKTPSVFTRVSSYISWINEKMASE